MSNKAMNNNYRSNFNQVIVNGNLAKTPNMTSYQSPKGKTVTKAYFDVLSDNYYQGYKKTADIQCVAFGKHAENIATNFKKGDFVEAKGTVQTYRAKKIQGVSLKYPITVTRFNIYSLAPIKKGAKLSSSKSDKKQVKVTDNDLPF